MSMFFLLTAIGIPILVGIIHRILTRDDWLCGPEMSIFVAFMTAIVILLGHLLLSAEMYERGKLTVEPRAIELVSTTLGDSIKGQFFLGCGSINGEEQYRYFRKTENGNFVREGYPVSKSQVREADETPRMTWNHYVRKTPDWTGYGTKEWDADVVFVIPKGSIIQRFDMR